LLLAVGSTDPAYRLWISLGMKSLDRRWPQENYRVVGDVSALAESVAIKWGVPKHLGNIAGRFAVVLMPPFTPVAWCRNYSACNCKIENFLPEDEDAIQSCRASDALTYAWRDVRILNWLYFGSSYVRQTRTVFVARSGHRLIGYLTMKLHDQQSYIL